ncbi:MAG: phosphoadenylyl-sulfate reductase [Anaerolineales bacterium]
MTIPASETTEPTTANFESATPQEILSWACGRFERICVAASFGKDSVTLLHMLRDIKPDIDVIYLNTGYDFPETLTLIESLRAEWGLNIKEYRPLLDVEEQEQRFGADLYKTDPDRCCGIRKVEPMARALEGYDAWITGLRRDETEFRKHIQVAEVQDGIQKVNPLANWTEEEVWGYIRANGVPGNPLYDKGYRSLGCWPCTLAGTWGRFERAGRWAGTSKAGGECGIHVGAAHREKQTHLEGGDGHRSGRPETDR